MATTPDTRSTSSPGESRNGHFTSAVSKVHDQRSIMAHVFRGRSDDMLDYGGDDFDRAD